jgi:hypothetical protein
MTKKLSLDLDLGSVIGFRSRDEAFYDRFEEGVTDAGRS